MAAKLEVNSVKMVESLLVALKETGAKVVSYTGSLLGIERFISFAPMEMAGILQNL